MKNAHTLPEAPCGIIVVAFRVLLAGMFCVCAAGLEAPADAQAERSINSGARSPFSVPKGLEGRVGFWKLVFTRYGENHRVFHHRLYPEVIYSVLDFSEFEAKFRGKELMRAKENAVAREITRIRTALEFLGADNAPRTAFERRIVKLFKHHIPGSNTKRYRIAADEEQIRYQRGIRERFREGLVRSGRYLYAIEEIFRGRGLPVELGRLPLVESSFNYEAYSSVGAAGIWQFMPATGRKYMQVTSAIDERRDAVIASRAAAEYLAYSYSKVGSWPLAVTSYNHGLSGVMRAAKETGSTDIADVIANYKSESFGFASSNFYAEFLAALEVEQNAEQFFPGIVREAPWRFDEVRIGKSMSFPELQHVSGAGKEELAELNQAFMGPITKNRKRVPQSTVVKVPRGKGKKVTVSVAGSSQLPAIGTTYLAQQAPKVVTRQSYIVEKGDTLAKIASHFGVGSGDLLKANGVREGDTIHVGQKLVIPSGGIHATAAVIVARPEREETVGDKPEIEPEPAPVIVASRFESSAEVIPDSGDTSRTAEKAETTAAIPTSYKVEQGDTVQSISRKFSIDQRRLMAINNLKNPKSLRIGRELLLPKTGNSESTNTATRSVKEPTAKQAVLKRSSEKRLNQASAAKRKYKVVPGDNLSKIARKTGSKVDTLRKLNPQAKAGLKPGQVLLLE